jgi:sucrose phosphorylase
MAHLIEGMIGFGGRISMKTNPDGSISPYEINITYFDAMKGTRIGADHLQEERFLCSQTIMLALKGIPAIYIHSLLLTPNDYAGVETTGRARSINRKQLLASEVNNLLNLDTHRQKIFNELIRRIKIRRQSQAFHPSAHQEVILNDERLFSFHRYSERTGEKIVCISNITAHQVTIQPVFEEQFECIDLLSGESVSSRNEITFKPYQTRWLRKLA